MSYLVFKRHTDKLIPQFIAASCLILGVISIMLEFFAVGFMLLAGLVFVVNFKVMTRIDLKHKIISEYPRVLFIPFKFLAKKIAVSDYDKILLYQFSEKGTVHVRYRTYSHHDRRYIITLTSENNRKRYKIVEYNTYPEARKIFVQLVKGLELPYQDKIQDQLKNTERFR